LQSSALFNHGVLATMFATAILKKLLMTS